MNKTPKEQTFETMMIVGSVGFVLQTLKSGWIDILVSVVVYGIVTYIAYRHYNKKSKK